MNISSVNGSNGLGSPVGVKQPEDSYGKNLQNQVVQLQKQLQELAKNSEMDPETKMKKRQEIQQQISDLNMQLRQHQVEERRRAQQEKAQEAKAGQAKAQEAKAEETSGMPQGSMAAIISAQGSLEQARIQGNTATQMQDRADVLETEMKLDSSRGGDTSRKAAEKAEAEAKAQTATASQMSTLAEASRTMSEAAEAENESGTVDGNEKKADKTDKTDETDKADKADGSDGTEKAAEAAEEKPADGKKNKEGAIGENIDVRI